MKITFLGAAKTVTGSNFLVTLENGTKFIVDCGMYQGRADLEEKNYDDFMFDVNEINFMLLTHAHIDHSGRIPKLYKEGYRNPIYAQKATCELCSIMLPDSGHIQEMEIEWKNKKRIRQGKEPLEPMYTAEEAMQSLEVFKKVQYDEIVEINDSVKVRFNDAGHMLGSSIIEVWVNENGKETKAVFTGDLGNNDIPLLASPTMIESADYLIMESTYGNRLHMRNDDKAKIFLDVVYETIEKNGTVVIPTFAVGRTQEILYELNKIKENTEDEEFIKKYDKLMHIPVYVDSPLAVSATEIFRNNTELFDYEVKEAMERGDNPLEFPGLQFTRTVEESKALNASNESSIILSASGMCEVGRIKHHLKHHIWNPNSTVLFVGYQAPGTLGRRIVDGEKSIKIFGDEVSVNARIEYIEGFSGHADQTWLLNFISSFYTKPRHIFLVHGEEEGQEVLKEKIEEQSDIGVTIPSFGETYTLDESLAVEKNYELPKKYRPLRLEVIGRINTLKEEIEDMENIVRNEKLSEKASDNEIIDLNNKIKELEQQIVKIIE